jgi:hypothetical protein
MRIARPCVGISDDATDRRKNLLLELITKSFLTFVIKLDRGLKLRLGSRVK